MKLWLTGATNKDNAFHLKELISPIQHVFDGLVWVFHYPKGERPDLNDEGAIYLEENKKEGRILHIPWCNRIDFSRNAGLYYGPIEYGDWFLTIDTMERMHVDFANMIRSLIDKFDENGIDGVFLRDKHFLFKFNEATAYRMNPHSGVAGIHKSLEITKLPFWKDEYWQNVRHTYRDKYDFVDHNLKYYLFPSTNHLVLKCEHDNAFIQKRYEIRGKFLSEMDRLKIPVEFKAVKDYIITQELSPIAKECIASEKILNDVYRFYKIGDKSIADDFQFNNLITIP